MLQAIICKRCNSPTPRTGRMQKYCPKCSERSDIERKRSFAQKTYPAAQSAIAERGRQISKQQTATLVDFNKPVDLAWQVRLSVPFSWSGSKNHMFTKRAYGHIALRGESKAFRDAISHAVKVALRGQKVVQNKVWLDIFVQKPNQRGDATNFIDLVCDAVKVAIGVDDRWFSIRRLDWQIAKDNPQIFIGIGQEAVIDAQACSSCGRVLALDQFQQNRALKAGVSRNCRECSSARKKPRLVVRVEAA